jgi:hypothetical protein
MRCTVEPQARLAIIKFDAGEISCVATNWVHSVRPLCTSCQVLARPKSQIIPSVKIGGARLVAPLTLVACSPQVPHANRVQKRHNDALCIQVTSLTLTFGGEKCCPAT